MSLLIQNQLFPQIDLFKVLSNKTDVEIFECEPFKKSTYRNRYAIATANGVLLLTVPVSGGREQKAYMKDLLMDDSQQWRAKHWKGIVSAYKKAPYFDYYEDAVHQMLFLPERSLFLFNITILKNICNLLNIKSSINISSGHSEIGFDSRAYHPISHEKALANDQEWKPKYPQVFEDRIGFQPGLSILDLLFCEGPNSLHSLQESMNS